MVIAVALALSIVFIKPVPLFPDIKFSKSQAFEDILYGKVKRIFHGIGGPGAEVNWVAGKYGFEEYNLGCVDTRDKGEEVYQKIIEKYLQDRNGKPWRSKYQLEVEAIRRYQDSMFRLRSSNSK